MADQEINEAVARKLGWKDTSQSKCGGPQKHANHGDFYSCYEGIPDYCHRIEAAWKIVEISETMVIAKLSSGWACNPTPPGFENLVKAESAPMAICLAFLKIK